MKTIPFPYPSKESFLQNVMDKLKLIWEEISYPKGYVLFNRDKIERDVYLIKQGIARAYIEVEGRDVTIWFGQENDIIISAQGYVNGRKGYETIELLEDAVLYKMNLEQLHRLYEQDIDVCNWARKLIEKEFVGTEHHLISNLSMSATERYLQLLKEKPEILQRVQLRHIASYLGISSEHLSRIRANTKNRVV
ncbi:Crp/Fnr family transcriptional regulator [Bacteroides sp.]